MWFVWRWIPFLFDEIPLNFAEPQMALDFSDVLEPFLRIACEQPPQQIFESIRQKSRETHVGLENFLHRFLTVVRAKGRASRDHVVQQGTKAPPVHFLAVALSVQDLRRPARVKVQACSSLARRVPRTAIPG